MALPVLTAGTDQWLATELLLVLCVILVILYYYYATSYHGVWEKVGVPGPKPWPFFDHRLEIGRAGLDATIPKWFKQYGKTFGVYGLHPHLASLVTKDLDLIKQVLVKDTANFNDRIPLLHTWGITRNSVSHVNGDTWKRHRHVISPMFSGAKMKIMIAPVVESTIIAREVIMQSIANNDVINVKEIANKFFAEVIARVVFGVTTHAISKEESEFEFFCRKLITFKTIVGDFVRNVSFYFPPVLSLSYFISYFDTVDSSAEFYFVNVLKSAMKKRRRKINNSGIFLGKDMLDLMMDKEVSKHSLNYTNSSSLTEDEIIGNFLTFIIAGMLTMPTTLQSIMYCLCTHPEVQEKLAAEIDTVVPPGEIIQYKHLSQLKYTEQVIQECLRLYPTVNTISRSVSNTKTYNGITIPKGTVVQISLEGLGRNPEYFPEPDTFNPDRFSLEAKSERDPVAFLGFSYGPRVCVGQRLAMMALKVAIVSLLKDFRFSLSDRTNPRKGEAVRKLVLQGSIFTLLEPVKIEGNFRKDFSQPY